MDRKIDVGSFRTASMNLWQEYFNDIFRDRNKELNVKALWLKVIEHSTKVAEGIRKRTFSESIESVAKAFVWICSFISNNPDIVNGEKIEDLVWYKYPRACAYCVPEMTEEIEEKIVSGVFKGVQCVCTVKSEEEPDKYVFSQNLVGYRRLKDYKPDSLNDWADMFSAIYQDRHSLMSVDSVCFHFFEEVGEVLTALRIHSDYTLNFQEDTFDLKEVKRFFDGIEKYQELANKRGVGYHDFLDLTKQSIKDEIADVISWLFSLTQKLFTLRSRLSDYEATTVDLLKKFDEIEAVANLLGYYPIRTPKDDKLLHLSSILFVWYGNGCYICRNYKLGKERCICDFSISTNVIY
ncbi:MAG: hypothetical protein JSV18_07465 [Candidatus Bathyarchaeota archaeon]|nr:MAG: hypothetical protein JSV18_07465 [Candidatus Bathyarchaeota archaeon]